MTDTEAEPRHIFVVEDDEELATLVQEYFQLQGFKVTLEGRGDRAVERIIEAQPDAVILDIMLPGLNGIDVCRQLRMQSDVPVLMLTARTDDIDQVVGLEVGADDYICKPVQPRLLLARVNAILRRVHRDDSEHAEATGELQFGQLVINTNKREVMLNNAAIELTTNEIDLLSFFARQADTILSRDELFSHLRGFGYDGMDRTVDMLVSRLRKKLGDNPHKPHRIKTVWKKGYLFVSDAWE
ncbi:DNA-binding response regulator [Neiella marina]|uniref:DNA-binding response regulator n=1 Tax=Neiella marina TaxID=508461 RepID=A0A8J2UA39_9GAMM|nr:response regulator transcription factor [Neiella marina]GGA89723.1 DNA-binding response regulator [Neiella marina]